MKKGYYRLRMISNKWFVLKYDAEYKPEGELGPFITIDVADLAAKETKLNNLDQTATEAKVPYSHG